MKAARQQLDYATPAHRQPLLSPLAWYLLGLLFAIVFVVGLFVDFIPSPHTRLDHWMFIMATGVPALLFLVISYWSNDR